MKLQGMTPNSVQAHLQNEVKRLKEMLIDVFDEIDSLEEEIKELLSEEEYKERLIQKSKKEFENFKAGKWKYHNDNK